MIQSRIDTYKGGDLLAPHEWGSPDEALQEMGTEVLSLVMTAACVRLLIVTHDEDSPAIAGFVERLRMITKEVSQHATELAEFGTVYDYTRGNEGDEDAA